MEIYVDPHNKYSLTLDQTIEACGFLLPWALDWFHEASPLPLSEYLQQAYGFPSPHHKGATIDSIGTFLYPDDPPLSPIIKLTFEREDTLSTLYIYPYALIAIQDAPTTSFFITRMD